MLAIIVGMTQKRIIGKGNELPWHIYDDLQNFKKITSGCTVIMGLKTFYSIGKALPNRNNIVLNFEKIDLPGCTVITSIPEAIKLAESFGKPTFCIGGASIYKQFLLLIDKFYISWIKKDYPGDVYFPEFDLNEWIAEEKKDFPEFEFVIYGRKKK
jgi:dihydrofolate reductase